VRCREGWTWQEGEENRCKEDKTARVIIEKYKRFMVAKQIAKERDKESSVVSDITVGKLCKQYYLRCVYTWMGKYLWSFIAIVLPRDAKHPRY